MTLTKDMQGNNMVFLMQHIVLQICVNSCPSTYWHYAYQVALETATTKTVSDRATDMICKPGTDTTVVSLCIMP